VTARGARAGALLVLAPAILIAALAGSAGAHEPERAQALLADVAARHAAVRAPGAGAEALYALGEAAEAMVGLLNEDVAVHGAANFFTDALVRRLEAYGIAVALQPRTRTYAYDLAAFATYVERAPRGPHAADAAFRLLARDFDAALGADLAALGHGDVPALLRTIGAEERFLRDHPRHPRAPRVRFFLAVDYVRAARHVGDPAQAAAFTRRARQALAAVAQDSSDPFERRAAGTLLEQLGAAGR
jgi:hypothetical protein